MSAREYIEAHCPLLYEEIERRIEAGKFDVYSNLVDQLRVLYSDIMDAPPCPANTITRDLLGAEQVLQER